MQNSITALGGIISILMYVLIKGAVGRWYKWRADRRTRVVKVRPLV